MATVVRRTLKYIPVGMKLGSELEFELQGYSQKRIDRSLLLAYTSPKGL